MLNATRPMSGMETWHALLFLPFRFCECKAPPMLSETEASRRKGNCTHVSQFVVRPSIHSNRSNVRTGATLRKKITQMMMMMMMRQRLVMALPSFFSDRIGTSRMQEPPPRHRLRFAAVVVERRRLPTFSLSLASSSS